MTWPKKLQIQRQKRQRHFEKGDLWDIFDQSDEDTWHDQQRQRHSENTTTNTYGIEVWNCWHFRHLRTWVHDNHCYQGIKSDTGQHSQFLQCLPILCIIVTLGLTLVSTFGSICECEFNEFNWLPKSPDTSTNWPNVISTLWQIANNPRTPVRNTCIYIWQTIPECSSTSISHVSTLIACSKYDASGWHL